MHDVVYVPSGGFNEYEIYVKAQSFAELAPFAKANGDSYFVPSIVNTNSTNRPNGSYANMSTTLYHYIGNASNNTTSPTRIGFTSSGNIRMASGAGIDFSATGDGSGSETSELFDDYEEGTWTPYLARWTGGAISATYTEQVGRYTKVGRVVTLSFSITTSAISSQGSSLLYIGGLPYNNSSSHNYMYAGTFGLRTAISSTTVSTSVIKHSTNNSLLFREDNNFQRNVDNSWLVGEMRGSITYEYG